MPEIRVPGEPVSKERPRRGKNGSFYTPSKTARFEHLVAWTWKATRARTINGPVSVTMHFRVGGRDKDIDNMVKAALDGLQQGAAFLNDRQVISVLATKELLPGRGESVIRVEAARSTSLSKPTA
jgi:Holliday junction resolvase RusA-like endonuclease